MVGGEARGEPTSVGLVGTRSRGQVDAMHTLQGWVRGLKGVRH